MDTNRCSGRVQTAGVVTVAFLLVTTFLGPLGAGTAAATPDEGEPNDSRENATEVAPGSPVTGEVSSGDDVDWFAVEADRGETINATMTAGPGSNDFKLYPPDSGFVGDTDVSNGTASIGTTAQSSGTYYIRVRAEGDGADYTLVTEVTGTGQPAQVTAEPGGGGATTTSSDGGPGFTAPLAVLAVVTTLLALVRHRS